MKKFILTTLLFSLFSFSLEAKVKLFYNQFSESIILTSSWEKTKLLKQDSPSDLKSIKMSYLALWNGKNNGEIVIFFLASPNLSLEEEWYVSFPTKAGTKKLSYYGSSHKNNLNPYMKKTNEAWYISFCFEELLELQKFSKENKKGVLLYLFNSKGEKIPFIWNKYKDLNVFLEILIALLP